jgi:Stress responsive A/B Barrel Domain
VIAHVVLFTPRASLSPEDRRALVGDLERACQAIPAIRRARIGRRRVLGYGYDTVGPVHFEFVAVLEFESEADLHIYLRHPAHIALGRWFHHGAEVAIAEDFETVEAEGLRGLVRDYTEG